MRTLSRVAALFLALLLLLPDPAIPSRAEEADFQLIYSGSLVPGGTLTFSTDPQLEGVLYGLRWDSDSLWTILDGSTYILPDPLPADSSLTVTAIYNDVSARNLLELEIPAVPPETPIESQPQESAPSETMPEETFPAETQPEVTSSGPGLYFGMLHAHSNLSGGTADPEAMYAAAAELGLDFFALTDHSHSLDGGDNASVGEDTANASADWAAGQAAAQNATTDTFLALFGYEMSWHAQSKLGHITTLNTPGFHTREQALFRNTDTALSNYYAALAAQPDAVGQFNHPGNHYGTFQNFAYSPEGDQAVSLMEVFSGKDCCYEAYIKALDQGWHLAPTGNPVSFSANLSAGPEVRTVVFAQSLTQADLYAGLRARRVYATQDRDLEIGYLLNGHRMGSILPRRTVGETAQLAVTLNDLTDSAIGLVEVITSGGTVAASQTVAESWAYLTFSLPAENPWYFIRVTQPDDDLAVTAPVWIEQKEDLGIRDLSCETAVPVQKQPLCLSLTLYNRETVGFSLESTQILVDGTPQPAVAQDGIVPAYETMNLTLTPVCDAIGPSRITVRVNGTLEGSPRSFEESLELSFRRTREVTDLLVDGSHGNSGVSELSVFRKIAGDHGVRLTVLRDAITAQQLKSARLVIIPAPTTAFEEAFLRAMKDYVAYGGSVLVCADDTAGGCDQLNRLLEAIGATARIGAAAELGQSTLPVCRFYRQDPLCAGISDSALYRVSACRRVDPGEGQWLANVRSPIRSDQEYTVLSRESTVDGGTVLTAGSLLFADDCVKNPDSLWSLPYANRTLAKALLGIAETPMSLTPIRQARQEDSGALLRIRGYVTAGTANPYNRFSNTLYLQDDTGGIAVIPFTEEDIAPGTPFEITGYVQSLQGNVVLKSVSCQILEAESYLYPAQTGDWEELLDPSLHGGELVMVEGICMEVSLRRDGTVSGITLTDDGRNTAHIIIEEGIGNGSNGKNTLHNKVQQGRIIRAMGLLHLRADGTAVIRVRNCEEVVYVPPLTEIPMTGDLSGLPGAFLLLSAGALLVLIKRRKNGAYR